MAKPQWQMQKLTKSLCVSFFFWRSHRRLNTRRPNGIRLSTQTQSLCWRSSGPSTSCHVRTEVVFISEAFLQGSCLTSFCLPGSSLTWRVWWPSCRMLSLRLVFTFCSLSVWYVRKLWGLYHKCFSDVVRIKNLPSTSGLKILKTFACYFNKSLIWGGCTTV